MIKRLLEKKIKEAVRQYPVVGIIGPRQSGKTTLARNTFAHYPYVSLEKPSELTFALEDPEGFLNQFPKGAIIDEIQRAPELFSYIQTIVDQKQKEGLFILTGSQNFVLLEKISQSLAGRISIQKLLPFSLEELVKSNISPPTLGGILFKGGYPRIYDKHLAATDWLSNYVSTYLERDVRSIKNVGDLSTFQRFLKMCAFRSGKVLNLSSLANDCGITHNTTKAWISVLEASFIIFLLNPYHKNFKKRLIKAPKLYFYDTGLMCFLIGITNDHDITLHPEIGSIFETFVISELIKIRINRMLSLNFYFWRDKIGREIDCIFEKNSRLLPIEIKSGQTIRSEFFNNLNYWSELAGGKKADSLIIYAGSMNQKRSNGQIMSWRNIINLGHSNQLGS
jgi:predicted AAA+ superfamily ATPase